MKFKQLISCALAVASMVCVAGSLPATRSLDSTSIPAPEKEPPEFFSLRGKGNALFRSGQYAAASQIYEAGYQQAIERGETRSALRFLNNLGSVRYAQFQYRAAIKAYLAAKNLAAGKNQQEILAAVDFNIASIFYQMGDMDAATESVASGLAIPPAAAAKFKAQLLILSAEIEVRRNNFEHAYSLFRDAVAAAKANHDSATESLGWNEFGATLLNRGELARAEQALLAAQRIRQAGADNRIHYTWESLAELRSRQGDVAAASSLYDKAIASAEPLGPSAAWTAYFLRGRARMSQGRLEDAYSDLEESLRLIRIARVQVLPADAFRVGQESQLAEVYAAFIESGSELYQRTRKRSYARQTFAAAEEGRAASLRALWAGRDLTAALPSEYWQTLVELQQAETAELHSEKHAEERVRHARVRLTELEMVSGLDLPVSPDHDAARAGLLELTQASLSQDEIYISFHLGVTESCIWVVSRAGFELRPLRPSAEYIDLVARFNRAVQEGSAERADLGKRLYQLIFGTVSRQLLDKPVWIVAPDGPLFQLPFAALGEPVKPGSADAQYVIERHTVSITPVASALLGTSAQQDPDALFVGVGDPIYNRADPRLNREPASRSTLLNASLHSGLAPLELARLPGSAREVRMCADISRSHGQQTVLLEGAVADKRNLTDALRRNPGVLHIAAHVLFPARDRGPAMLALTLQPGYQPQLLSAIEIANVRSTLGLVVLDGCNSARGEVLPGAGLMGMIRAWMATGARAVIATRWPMADIDEGEIFKTFYPLYYSRNQRTHTDVSRVLQQAQLAELRAGGPHAEPAYWASYFSVQRN